MFLNKPHVAHRHESFLLREFSNTIFQDSQSKLPYYTTSHTFYKLEALFREEKFHPELKPYKPHLLMIFRQAVGGYVPNLFSERPIDQHSLSILNILKNDAQTKQKFEEAAKIFKDTTSKWTGELKRSKFAMKDVQDFTELLIRETSRFYSTKPSEVTDDEAKTYRGVVYKTMHDKFGKYCGFIKRQPDNIFFHSKQNKNLNFVGLEGKVVTYKVTIDSKNNQQFAVEVELVSNAPLS